MITHSSLPCVQQHNQRISYRDVEEKDNIVVALLFSAKERDERYSTKVLVLMLKPVLCARRDVMEHSTGNGTDSTMACVAFC